VEPEYLNSPADLTAYPKNGQIKIIFYSNNKEDMFDGFNIYVSESSSLKTQTDILPVKNPATGSIPTINNTSKQISPTVPIEVTITRDADDNPIENSVRYYIIVKAHSIRNFKSEPSNETSTTPRIENTGGTTIAENEGFNFNALTKSIPYDLIFKIINNQPYLQAGNNAVIQSKGYSGNWELINTADTEGYVGSETPLIAQTGYVYLIRTSDNRYGKIQVTAVQTSPTASITIIWAFQQIINNKDI